MADIDYLAMRYPDNSVLCITVAPLSGGNAVALCVRGEHLMGNFRHGKEASAETTDLLNTMLSRGNIINGGGVPGVLLSNKTPRRRKVSHCSHYQPGGSENAPQAYAGVRDMISAADKENAQIWMYDLGRDSATPYAWAYRAPTSGQWLPVLPGMKDILDRYKEG